MRGQLAEIASRHRLIDPLLPGARVLELGAVCATGARSARSLQDRGAASVVSLDRDPAALTAAAQEGGGPGLHFRAIPWADQKDAAFDLILAHEPSWLLGEPGLPELRRLLAPGGQLLVTLRGDGPALGQLLGDEAQAQPPYDELAALLAEAFASVEVVVQRAIVGYALAPLAGAAATLAVEELSTDSEAAGHILFLCGERASGLVQRKLVLSRLQPLIEQGREGRAAAGRLAQEQAAAQLAEQRRALEVEHAAALELAETQAASRWEVEREALRSLAAAQAPLRDVPEADEELMRRVRVAEERAEAARLHAKEAEARMRAAERRADAAEAERAKSSLAARRYQAEAEQARRVAEGAAHVIAPTPAGSAGRPA